MNLNSPSPGLVAGPAPSPVPVLATMSTAAAAAATAATATTLTTTALPWSLRPIPMNEVACLPSSVLASSPHRPRRSSPMPRILTCIRTDHRPTASRHLSTILPRFRAPPQRLLSTTCRPSPAVTIPPGMSRESTRTRKSRVPLA